MAAKTKIVIGLLEHLWVGGAMHVVADDAAFTQGLVLKDKRLGLLLVAFGTGLIPTRHRQTARRLANLFAMGIMAIDAVHLAFGHRMAMWKLESCSDAAMALKAGLRLFPGIDNGLFPIPAGIDVLAAGAVA